MFPLKIVSLLMEFTLNLSKSPEFRQAKLIYVDLLSQLKTLKYY